MCPASLPLPARGLIEDLMSFKLPPLFAAGLSFGRSLFARKDLLDDDYRNLFEIRVTVSHGWPFLSYTPNNLQLMRGESFGNL